VREEKGRKVCLNTTYATKNADTGVDTLHDMNIETPPITSFTKARNSSSRVDYKSRHAIDEDCEWQAERPLSLPICDECR
jgi:hypothetical protein